MATPNLQEIVERSRAGDMAAFRTLMEEFQGYAFSVAMRTLGDAEEARDVVQEAFIRVWRHLNKYDSQVKFTTWLYAIVSRLCLDSLRSRSRRPVPALDDELVSELRTVALEDDPERSFDHHEVASMIGALTETLPPKQKIIFVLRDLQDLNVKEVAEILGISEASVKTNLVYARRAIREQLECHHIKAEQP